MTRPGSVFNESLPAPPIEPAPQPHRLYDLAVRMTDLVVGFAALVISLPVLVVAAALVAVSMRSNPFIVQPRVGYRGEVFGMLKLRTMTPGPPPHRPPGWETSGKPRSDERVTRLGRILRRTSVDELPQLFNVLRREMALVGPRPMLPVEAETLTMDQMRRFGVRPGMTGLWQTSGRGSLPGSRWLEIDLMYVDRRSWAYDMRLVLRTPLAVVSMRGAW